MLIVENVQIILLFDGNKTFINRAIWFCYLIELKLQVFGEKLIGTGTFGQAIIMSLVWKVNILDKILGAI